MQEFAPTKSRPPGNCPSDEELAAYIDGGLEAEEKDRIAGHLLSCERCYQIYTETLQFQLEEEPNVVSFPSRPRERRTALLYGLSLAALLLAGLGLGGYVLFLAAPPRLSPGSVTASLPGAPGLEKGFWLGPTFRGPGDGEDILLEEASFRMGVQLVNLRLTLEAGDVEQATGNILPRIRQILDAQSGTSPLVSSYGGLLDALLHSHSSRESLGKAERIALESREYFDETYFDLGLFVEAGRLSALARSPAFFRQAGSRKFLRRLLWNDRLDLHGVKLDPPTRASLDRISKVLSKGDLQPADYDEIRRQLEAILDLHYPM